MKTAIAEKGRQPMQTGGSTLSREHRILLKWSLFAAATAVALAVDLVTKHLAEARLILGHTDKILPFLYLERTANSGVAFGLLGGRTALIVLANIVALAIVGAYVFIDRRAVLAGLAGGMVVGGSLGNLVQRLTGDGHVTDFLKFPHWPNFNMADVFIDVGIAVVVIGLAVELVRSRRSGRSAPSSEQ